MKRVFVVSLMTGLIALAGCGHPAYYAPGPPPPPPPPAYQHARHEGFHDGVMAARRDRARGMGPDVDRHPRFRRPPVPPPLMGAYRNAFQNGYRSVYRDGDGDRD